MEKGSAMTGSDGMGAREDRLTEIRREAEANGLVRAAGIRAAGSPMPIASATTGYYGQPMLKEPQWTPLIPLYFFIGGASGSLGIIGSLADLLGDHEELAEHARWLTLAGVGISSVLLVVDLGRPSRFLNMLRVFKPQSTMSVGSWVLSSFATFVGASSFGDLLARFLGKHLMVRLIRGAGRVGTVLFGMPFHNYTGVLIGASVIPVWNKRIHSLPREFGMSGLQAGVSVLELTTGSTSPALNALALLSGCVESYEGFDLLRTDDPALLPAKRGWAGWLVQAAGVLSGPLPMALRLASIFMKEKKGMRRLASWSGIIGSLCLRYGWVYAGTASSRQWELPMRVQAGEPPVLDGAQV